MCVRIRMWVCAVVSVNCCKCKTCVWQCSAYDLRSAAKAAKLKQQAGVAPLICCRGHCIQLLAVIPSLQVVLSFCLICCQPERIPESWPAMPAPLTRSFHCRLPVWLGTANPRGVQNTQPSIALPKVHFHLKHREAQPSPDAKYYWWSLMKPMLWMCCATSMA